MQRILAAALLTLLTVTAAEAACLSRDLGSNCYAPGGNSYLSRPGQHILRMPQADPRIAPVPQPLVRPRRAGQARGPFPTVNGRVLRHPGMQPGVDATTGRQQRYFGAGCASPRCFKP